MKRRDFLGVATSSLLACAAPGPLLAAPSKKTIEMARRLPRWRGFNLQEKFTLRRNAPFVENDFKWLADWGFDFARLPTEKHGSQVYDRDWLYRTNIEPWKKLEAAGVGIHVGEWGAYRPVPCQVALAWMRDNLTLWKEAGWGWSLWNLRGGFGIVDSNREGVNYEEFHGHQLDREMLKLLQEF